MSDEEKSQVWRSRSHGSAPSQEVKQRPEQIFISQEKYVDDLLKKFNMQDYKPLATPMATHKQGNKETSNNQRPKKMK